MTALLAVSVVATIVVWSAGSSAKPLRVVRGVIGSEQRDFLGDPRVKAAFAERGLDVRVDAVGDRQIATMVGRAKYDFAFGAETPELQKSLTSHHITTSSTPFFSPLAVATFTDVAQLLEHSGLAHDQGGWWTLDMKGFLDLVARHVRWNELPGNTTPATTKYALITSADVTTSNSGAMYASIASYVANEDRVLRVPRTSMTSSTG